MQEVAQIFRSGRLLIRRDHKLLFVCGGPTNEKNHRSAFLQYSAENLPDYKIFLAESSFSDIRADGDHNFINISDLERFICDVADFVLIFPESAGSFAEVGYFSAFDDLSAKTLVANQIGHQADPSFLNLGPIHKINQKSQFGQTVYVVCDGNEPDFEPIKGVLGSAGHKKSYRIEGDEIENAGLKQKFYIAIHLFSVFPILHPVELSILFKNIFGKSNYSEVRYIVSVLASAKYITRGEDEPLFFANVSDFTLAEIEGISTDEIKAKILSVYQRDASHLLELRAQNA